MAYELPWLKENDITHLIAGMTAMTIDIDSLREEFCDGCDRLINAGEELDYCGSPCRRDCWTCEHDLDPDFCPYHEDWNRYLDEQGYEEDDNETL